MKTQVPQKLFLTLFALLLLAFAPAARAVVTSTASGGLWTATTTWSGGVVPVAADDVVIATTGTSQVQLNASSSAANVTINPGATLGLNDAGNGRTLTIAGNLVNNGTITLGTGATTSGTAKLTFSGAGRTWTGSGDISGVKCGLQVNTSGSLDISGLTTPVKLKSGAGGQPWAINGTLITGTQVIDNNGNTSMTVTFGATSSLVTANLNGIMAATGTFGNTFQSSQFTWTAGASVTFKGAGAQVTTGLPASIATLTINNPSGGTTLSAATTVTGTLTLTSGTLTTTAANLLTIGSAGTLSGGSSSSYVSGPLAQAYSGAVSRDFPIGVSPNYRKVTLNITVASGTPTITITPHEPSTFSCSAPSGYSVSGLRDWTVASSVAGPQTADLTVDATGYATATTLIQCVGGTATTLATTGTWPTLSATGISVGTSQEYVLGEVCAASAPTLTSVSDSGACTSVTVSWVTDGTSTYKIYRKTGAGAYSVLASGLTASPYNDSTAVGNTTYTYAVSTVAPCGAESTLAEFSPITTTAGKPAAPAQPTITPNCGSLTVNWSSVSGATSYDIYRKLSGGSYGAAIATGQTGTSYLDSGSSDSTKTYVYAVSGVDACEGFLSPDSAGASPSFAPSISSSPAASITNLAGNPQNLTVTATGTGLTYQWQVDKGGGFANAVENTDGTGSQTATFTTVAATTGMTGYRYQCVVSGTCSPSQTTSQTTLSVAMYMRSFASGSSGSAGNFEMSLDGTAEWVLANATPNSNCVVTIRSGHSLTNSSPNERQMRSLTIEVGGTFANGNGTTVRSLAIFGRLSNSGTLLSAGGASAHHLYFRGSGSWTGLGDLSTGTGGIDVTVDSGVVLDASGLTTSLKLHATVATPFTVNGTLKAGSLTINGNGNAANTFTLASGATLISANPNGLTGATAALNFVPAPSLSTGANYTFDGSSAQATTGLPAIVNNLTIANIAGAVSLSGNVAVNGILTVNLGADLDFNSHTVSTPSAPALNGALTMEVNKTGANTFTGSKLTQTAGTLTYGGTLTVTATGNALAGGDVIPLFSATSANYGGGFSPVTGPTVPTGLTRNAAQLTGGTGGNITINCDGSLVAHTATDTAICLGGSYSLNGSATGGGGSCGYSWVSSPAGFTSTAANPSVSPAVTTTYTLTVTDGNGCTAQASVTVTINVCKSSVTITSIVNNGDGTFTINYGGGAGSQFILVKSSDLNLLRDAWLPVKTNSATPGSFTSAIDLTNVVFSIESK